MKLSRLLTVVFLGILLTWLASDNVSAAEKAKVLMLTQSGNFTHGPVQREPKDQPKRDLAPAEVVMTQLGQQTGLFEVHCTQDAAADFTIENLNKHDVVVFYTQGDNTPIEQPVLEYFLNDWLKKKGHSFVGIHSATDTLRNYPPYYEMIGGTFVGHPWNADQTVTITVHDTEHPAMKPFGKEFEIKDEIYWYKNWQPDKVRVLMSLNLEKCATKGGKRKVKEGDAEVEIFEFRHIPVSWVKNYGEGRVFVTNLGHNESTWADKRFLDHLTGGMKWILGKEPAVATPNPEVSKAQEEKAIKDVSATK